MSNMAHCRFHNTLGDLSACFEAIEGSEIHSNGEIDNAQRLFIKIGDFLDAQGLLELPEDFGERVDEMIAEIKSNRAKWDGDE